MNPFGDRATDCTTFGTNMVQNSAGYAIHNDNQHSQWSGAVGIYSRSKRREENQMACDGAQERVIR